MKKLFALSFLSITALLIAGCGSGGGGGGGGTPTCQNGSVYDPATNTCVLTGSGVNPQAGPLNFYDYNRLFQYSYYGTQTFNGDMKITNKDAYRTFLKEAMAVCDRGTINRGLSVCEDWVSGTFQLDVRIDESLTPSVAFTAHPRLDLFNYYFQAGFDSGGYALNPLILSSNQNTLNLINQSKGLEIRANGTYLNGGGLRLIQIIVREGTLADNRLTYELFYPHNGKATQVATGILKRF